VINKAWLERPATTQSCSLAVRVRRSYCMYQSVLICCELVEFRPDPPQVCDHVTCAHKLIVIIRCDNLHRISTRD
jgi:hypothetical protein